MKNCLICMLSVLVAFAGWAGCVHQSLSPNRAGQDFDPKNFGGFDIIEGEYDTAPAFLKGRIPAYPPKAMFLPFYERKNPSYALMTFTIDTEGRAVNPKVREATHPQFAASVADALPSWRFTPAKKDGVPVEVRVIMRMNFELHL